MPPTPVPSPSSARDRLATSVVARDWEAVRAALDELGPGDGDPVLLEELASAAWWLGRVGWCIDRRVAAFGCWEARGEREAAARVALLLSEDHRRQGRGAVSASWRRRAATLLDGLPEGVQHGYLRLYEGEVARRSGRLDEARALLAEAAAVADRTGDGALAADVRQETGRVLILTGAHTEGLAVMDEAMLAALHGRLADYTTGKIYCCLISACVDLGDIDRVREWRREAESWLDQHRVPVFPGLCRVHEAEVLVDLGRWDDAEREAARASEELREVGWVAAYADNAVGQLRRLRGDLAGADAALAAAERRGASPDAERSLLLLAAGDPAGAWARIRRAVAANPSPALTRARLLPALVQIGVAVGEPDAVEAAVVELEEIAVAYDTVKLRAQAATARARLALARDDAVGAATAASAARRAWHELGSPYGIATARALEAAACRALGDRTGCAESLEIAAELLRSLGAEPELAEVERLLAAGAAAAGAGPAVAPSSGAPTAGPGGPLTSREVEVLGLVATGATNREIAARLVVSQKTVSRHLDNIFTKIGVSTRSAATAYAYRHGLARAAD